MSSKITILCRQIHEILAYNDQLIYGFADIGGAEMPLPYPGLKKGIIMGVPLSKISVRKLPQGISREYIDECYRANTELDLLGVQLEDTLINEGYNAISLKSSTSDYDPETFKTIFSHKKAATRAGIGWIGKSGLLVTKKFGSALRLNTVLTDAPLPTNGAPVTRSECGECTECTTGCSASAIKGVQWNTSLNRDDLIDVNDCYKECVDAAEKVGFEYPLCGKCIAACPWTIKYIQS